MLRLAYLTAIHGRHRVARAAVAHLARMRVALKTDNIDLLPLLVMSPGDVAIMSQLVNCTGFAWMAASNFPLSTKFQSGLSAARSMLGRLDAVIVAGSDDFLSARYVRSATRQAVRCAGCVQPSRLHFYELADGSLWRIDDDGFGAGRVFAASMLDRVGWELWPGFVNRGLDTHCRRWLQLHGESFAAAISRSPIIDVKTAGNLNSLGFLRQRLDLLPVVGADDVLAECNLPAVLEAC